MRYWVIHDDGTRYGPADVETLKQWASEGRLISETMLENEDGERQPARSLPEIASVLGNEDGERELAIELPEIGVASEVLFHSDFRDMNGLTQLTGEWASKDGCLTPVSGGESRIIFGSPDWTDFRIAVKATLRQCGDWGSGYGIYYRCNRQIDPFGYVFKYDAGRWRFSLDVLCDPEMSGVETLVKSVKRTTFPSSFDAYNVSHSIEVEVKADHHLIMVDGISVIDAKDESFPSGCAGFRVWSSSIVQFESVVVTKIG